MINQEELRERIFALRAKCAEQGELMFLGIPDRWCEKPGPKYRCINNHVSTYILLSETGDRCLECQEFVFITFPEDKDGPLIVDL